MPSIIRIDAAGGSGGRTRGWQARVYYYEPGRRSCPYISQLFSDRPYKGREKARRAAAAWIDVEVGVFRLTRRLAGPW